MQEIKAKSGFFGAREHHFVERTGEFDQKWCMPNVAALKHLSEAGEQ
jgi:hypothetical protein